MKRERNVFEKIIDYDNLMEAIEAVNKGHRFNCKGEFNQIVLAIEADKETAVKMLHRIITEGFEPAKPNEKRIYDKTACKERIIYEPRLWPDQYVHHALIQALTPTMMRGMDKFCCGSIKGRGTHYGIHYLKRWMKNDIKGTRYCAELDIYHFYNSIKPETVVDRFKKLIKDHRTIELIERLTRDGVPIGFYSSQWFANVLLQPLDQAIRKSGSATHYIRYIDNFTIFASNKRKLKRLIAEIRERLGELGLKLKSNWAIFNTKDRLPQALGYRYGRGYTLLRKRNLLRLKRALAKLYKKIRNKKRITHKLAFSIMSRLGQLSHCNNYNILKNILKPGTIKKLKNVIRKHIKRREAQREAYLQQFDATDIRIQLFQL